MAFDPIFRPRSRRSFLRTAAWGAAAGGALLSPFARLLDPSRAQAGGGAIPTRFLVVFSPNGTWPSEWTPDGGETDFRFRRVLAPLEPYRDRVLVTSGIDLSSTDAGPGDGHQKGMGHVLTGVPLLPGDVMGGCDSCPPVSWASDLSIDQAIADHIGESTRLRSLELGVLSADHANVWTRMCYRRASEPLPPESNPAAAYARVFGDPTLDPDAVRRRLALRQSLLDHQIGELSALESRLSSTDRERLQVHTETVRDLERRLTLGGAVGASCGRPELGGTLDHRDDDNIEALARLQTDIMVMAFACNLTRVGSIQWSNSVGQAIYRHLGFGDRHHDLSHEGDGNGDAVEKIIRINTWWAEQYAHILERLAAIPEGDGTMLDHTVVLWVNELGKGNSHTLRDMPFVLAGNVPRADGTPTFATGRHVRFECTTPHNDLLITLARAYGIDTMQFGDRDFCSGPLTRLLSA